MSIPSFTDYQSGKLNEAKVSFDGMNYVIGVFTDRQGIAVQFIPDSKTLDGFSKNEQVEKILDKLKKGMPEFASTLWFESGNGAAGLVFRVNTFDLGDLIAKAIK